MTKLQNRNLNIEVLEPLVLMSASPMNCEAVNFSHGTDGCDAVSAFSHGQTHKCGGDRSEASHSLAGHNTPHETNAIDLLTPCDGKRADNAEPGHDAEHNCWGGNRADYSIAQCGFGIIAVKHRDCTDFVADVEEIRFRDGVYKVRELTGDHGSSEDRSENCTAPEPKRIQHEDVSGLQDATEDTDVNYPQLADDPIPLFHDETSSVPETVDVDEQVLRGEPLAPAAPVSVGVPVEAPAELDNPIAACEAEFTEEAPEPEAPILETVSSVVIDDVELVGPSLVIDDSGLVPTTVAIDDIVSVAIKTDENHTGHYSQPFEGEFLGVSSGE